MVPLRFRTIAASPIFGTAQPGQVVLVPDAQAESLINGGYAERVESAEQQTHLIRETAQLAGQDNAMLPQGAPKSRKR